MTDQQKEPSKTRRTPSQQRSRKLVDAVVTAGLEIMEDEGPAALTVRSICKRAGVSVGSVYQYFGTKDALIEAVYQGQLTRGWIDGLSELNLASATLPLRDVLMHGILFACERELHLYELHPGYYRRYAHRLAVGDKMDGGDAIAAELRSIILTHRDQFRVQDVDTAVFFLVWGTAALLRVAVLSRPDMLRDPEFHRELTDLVSRYMFPDSLPSD